MRVLLALAALLWAAPAEAQDDITAKARAVHSRILALDAHVSFPSDPRYDFAALPAPRRELTLPAMTAGNLGGAILSITLQQGPTDATNEAKAVAEASLRLSQALNVFSASDLRLARSAAEVRALHADGQRAALLNLENGYVLGRHAELLDVYAGFGVRFFGPVYAGRNLIGDAEPFGPGADKAPPDAGLTDFGRRVIARANSLSIVIDVTHARERTALEMIAASRAPVIASHSGLKGVHNHPQNVSDAVAKAIAAKGGVVAVIGGWFALRPTDPAKTKAFEALREEYGFNAPGALAAAAPEVLAVYERRRAVIDAAYPKAAVSDLADHIDYAVKLLGVDHVGISSDFNGGGGLQDWPDASQSFNITLELVRRGYTEQAIAKIWGGNLLRVMEQAERRAKN
jgi:membrane dipeptidase